MVHKIADILAPGLSEEQIRQEYKDIVGELANMITGNAMNLFASTGKQIDITTPTVVEGKDVTIIAYGPAVHWALETLENNENIQADVIDLRTLMPWDKKTCLESSSSFLKSSSF